MKLVTAMTQRNHRQAPLTRVAGSEPVSELNARSSCVSAVQRSTTAAGPSSWLLRRFSTRRLLPRLHSVAGMVPVSVLVCGSQRERGRDHERLRAPPVA